MVLCALHGNEATVRQEGNAICGERWRGGNATTYLLSTLGKSTPSNQSDKILARHIISQRTPKPTKQQSNKPESKLAKKLASQQSREHTTAWCKIMHPEEGRLRFWHRSARAARRLFLCACTEVGQRFLVITAAERAHACAPIAVVVSSQKRVT